MSEKQVCRFTFSSLDAIDDAHYCTAHGRSPGILTVTTRTVPSKLNYYGDAIFTDGVRAYVIPDCRVNSVQFTQSAGGNYWQISISDHRWRWENARISGEYNKQDNRGNLVPGTIKTPKELTAILLDKMGETNYEIDMPEGVAEGEGPRDEFPPPGEGIKSIKAELNPPINWDNSPAGESLARLCDQYDRAIVWCNVDRKTKIVKRSVGLQLPPGAIENESGSLLLPAMPAGIMVVGAPIRWQLRFLLEDVAREWDNRLVPINKASYAPNVEPRGAIYQVGLFAAYNGATTYSVTINGRTFSVSGAGSTSATISNLTAQIQADGTLTSELVASAGSTEITITELNRQRFPITISHSDEMFTDIEQAPIFSKWDFSNPPYFPGVNPNENSGPDRMSYRQAVSRAQESIFRIKRLTLLDPGKGPRDEPDSLYAEHYGYITSFNQIILIGSKVEQVEPEARDPERIAAGNNTGDIVADVPNYYDGWSRDRLAEVFGAVYINNSAPVHKMYPTDTPNTKFGDRVEVPFSVDPANWCVIFQNPVYEYIKLGSTDGKTVPARLVLETSCHLRHPDTHEIMRYRRWVKFGQFEKAKTTEKRDKLRQLARMDNDEDCKRWERDPNMLVFDHGDELYRTWIQDYTVDEARRRHRTRGSHIDQYDTARTGGDKYLDKHLERIVLEGGYTRSYRGVYPVKLDGAIREVTFAFSASGMVTTASFNKEHDKYIPTNNVRRFQEALAPDVEAARQNREFAKQVQTNPVGPARGGN